MRELLAAAQQIGYQVYISDLDDDPELLGYCVPDERIIVVRRGMSLPQTRSTIAHEIGHAWYGHTCDSPETERQAYAYAARLLIDRERYEQLSRVSGDRTDLARALDVTPTIVDWYRATVLALPYGAYYYRRRAQLASTRTHLARTA